MKQALTVTNLKSHLSEINSNRSGFVPTMGALHKGHLALVERAINECEIVTVSIFVNPNQFNDKNDLKNYPRTLDKDMALLSDVMRKNDIVFTPDTKEIYPQIDMRVFKFGNLENVMEGEHRPRHFNGVAQVVTRLFDIVNPDFAYFGQKDFQQLTIIRELVKQTGNKVKIIGCPIVREPDGLAMSSRNQLLEPEIRKNAPIIFKTLSQVAALAKDREIADLKEFVRSKINPLPDFAVEYFEIADDSELVTISQKSEIKNTRRYFACIAVRAGKIRLIDNIEISLL
jgi:pantoate--beta-alanine ligase